MDPVTRVCDVLSPDGDPPLTALGSHLGVVHVRRYGRDSTQYSLSQPWLQCMATPLQPWQLLTCYMSLERFRLLAARQVGLLLEFEIEQKGAEEYLAVEAPVSISIDQLQEM
jgi:hypothetical protein